MYTELLNLFLQTHIALGHSPATVAWYRYQVTRWLDSGHTSVEAYLADSAASGNSPATVAGHYRALRQWFSWLLERGHIDSDPMLHLRSPKIPRHAPNRTSLDEYDVLLSSVPAASWVDLRDRLIICTLFLCGLRVGECARLCAGDFRTGDHLLLVRGGKTGDRLVPLLPAVERAFVAYLLNRPAWSGDALMLSADGGGNVVGVIRANGIRQMLRRRCRAAGLRNLNPHSFRHGLAMYLLNSGGDMSLVQRILGHSQIATTQRYYAEWLTEGLQREFAERMKGVGA